MRVYWSFLGLFLLYISAECLLPPSKDDLHQISQSGEKYLDKEIENAINGVKEMKAVMEKSEQDHKKFLSSLEETKKQKEREVLNRTSPFSIWINGQNIETLEKEDQQQSQHFQDLEKRYSEVADGVDSMFMDSMRDALKAAQDMEEKLAEEQRVCNDSMQALWEECKPCLKNTCIKYYSRTCSSGSGLVGRQLEEVLNRTSPFSIWINGQNIETLEKEDQQQSQHFQDLEKRYSEVADGVDSMFMDSMRVFDHMHSFQPLHQPNPFSGLYRMPSIFSHPARVYRSPVRDPEFHGFHSMFYPMMQRARDIFESFKPYMGSDMDFPTEDGSVNEDVIITKPFGNDKMTCREIRRNSAGCIKLREECEKCREIQHIDCSGKKPLEGPLKEELETALAMAERFTQEYNRILKHFEEEMFNTSKLLDMFSKQFGWVSSLANRTQSDDGIFKIHAVISKTLEDPEKQADTKVSVKLFDEPEMTFTVPGDIPWNDPKFSEVVAQEALDRYKQSTVVVK